MAISGCNDWSEILQRTDQPEGMGFDDFLNRALRPYFDEPVEKLTKTTNQLDGLTELVLDQAPGMGRRSLKRFSVGQPRKRAAEWIDGPDVLRALRAEHRERSFINRREGRGTFAIPA